MEYGFKNSVLGAALFAGIAFGVNANAGQIWNNFNLNASGDWVANFGANDLPKSSTFAHDFSFQLPAPVAVNGGSSIIADFGFPSGFNVTFNDFSLWNATTNTLISSGSTGGSFSTFNFGSIGPSNDFFKIHVEGTTLATGAGYAGNLTISPVPEPETYAMLLAGLGLIGFSVRRRVAAV